MRRRGVVLLAGLVSTTLLASSCSGEPNTGDPTVTASPGASEAPAAPAASDSPAPTPASGPPKVTGTIAEGLAVPWGIAFLPDGTALVTERDTERVLLVPGDGTVEEVGTIESAAPEGEGGLMGVAVSPDFATDQTVFFYLTTADDNRIVRATYDGTALFDVEPIFTGIPKGFIHDGGRLAFGPDGFLYASTGETGDGDLAQDRDSLGGKILRLTPSGDPAPGNPDGSAIWSLGHRNVQGLAFDDGDRLWASEFGDSTWDELNLIEKDANYGWPEVEGRADNGGTGFVDPQVVWHTSEASPSGLAWLDGSLWLGALRGARLWKVPVDGERAGTPRDFFVGDYGRLRTVVAAPDGTLWVTTSNKDGRGNPAPEDDRILQVTP
ncbi:PQQ-dependent sugar dehydrogenase [Nocardioides sp. InS609-2]|uniref:PQQ-dependent sugar dehydrogenase n=1 Tax=Nocardioides sp. InS609-2 TaxID=2760705 RepID=UPI0020BFD56B|nr:PQQ-dependent sugar dehydrogenase [Nocardioides sp. InS609-2]